MAELVQGLAGGNDAHFAQNQQRLRFLLPGYRTQFLPLVGDFIRQQIFGQPPRRVDFEPERLQFWPKVLLAAKSKRELGTPGVALPGPAHKNKVYGFDLGLHARQIEDGKDIHAGVLEGLRQGRLLRSTPQTWAAAVLNRIGLPVTPPNVTAIMARLDAAYHYDLFLWDLAQKQKYDFGRHDSDWLDSQQLYYLADPHIYLVTADRNIGLRTAKSAQRMRILSFNELRAMAGI